MSAFIDQQRAAGFAVELICRSIGSAPSAYYQRATGVLSTRAVEDARLLVQIRRVFEANYECYGSRRVWEQLRRDGVRVGRGRVERLMAANGLVGAKRRGRAWKTTIADPDGCDRPDLVNRDFTATRPDALWIADFTYLRRDRRCRRQGPRAVTRTPRTATTATRPDILYSGMVIVEVTGIPDAPAWRDIGHAARRSPEMMASWRKRAPSTTGSVVVSTLPAMTSSW